MDCEEMIEEKEKSGWLGGTFAQPGFIFTSSGHILFRKPDDSPARKFQLFLVERKGRMKQITKGEEEVTFIIKANFRCVGGCGPMRLLAGHLEGIIYIGNEHKFAQVVRIPHSVFVKHENEHQLLTRGADMKT